MCCTARPETVVEGEKMCCTAKPETIGLYGNAEFSSKGLGTEVFLQCYAR